MTERRDFASRSAVWKDDAGGVALSGPSAAWTALSMRARVLWLLGVYLVVSTGVGLAFLLELRQDQIAGRQKLISSFSLLMSEQTSALLQGTEQILQAADARLMAAVAAGTTDPDFIRTELRGLLRGRQYVNGLWILNERGRVIYKTSDGDAGFDASDYSVFIRHKDNPASAFGLDTPLVSRTTGRLLIPASQPLRRRDGSFAGVVVASVDPQYLDRLWRQNPALVDVAVALIRRDGTVLMRSPFDEPAMKTALGVAPIPLQLPSKVDTGTYKVLGGAAEAQYLVAYEYLAADPSLIILVGEDTRQVLAEWWRIARAGLGAWIAATVALGGLAISLAREWQARRRSELRYRMLFAVSPEPMSVFDRATGRFLALNDATVSQYGWSKEELLAMTVGDLLAEDEGQTLADMLPDETGEVGKRIRERLKHNDGRTLEIDNSLRAIEYDGRPAVLMSSRDITEQVRAERARQSIEEQLRQSQRMEAVGKLTGGVAHDFNNILMVIMANTEVLMDEYDLDAPVKEHVHHIDQATQRAADLTRQLLAFSRKQALQPQLTDVNDLVATIGRLLRRALGEQIELDAILADELWTVNIDRSQFETALINLCVNARDAMPKGGRLLVETTNTSLDEDYAALNPEAVAGDYVMIAVTDTGGGIPPEVLGKVFEPFFTTKEVGKGTGLGLSMVYGLVKQSNGHIKIYSELGRGTTIKIYLPRVAGQPKENVDTSAVTMPHGNERILVVEDDTQVRTSVVLQLRSLGYAVEQMPDGASGLAAFEAAATPYDLLLTDVIMPGSMTGKALATKIGERWPQTPVIFMSGYTENAIVHHGQLDAGVLLLTKPFRKRDLAKLVREALDARA
jgi:PAS domain S-box-containing protein